MFLFAKISNYLKESKIELKKVIWPMPHETLYHTLAVISISILTAVFLGSLDYIFNYILRLFIIK